MAPKHGPWCNSKTIRMECKYCDKLIFYQTCDCNSKVFYDSLGPPWPKHNCRGVDSSIGSIQFNRKKQKKKEKIERDLNSLKLYRQLGILTKKDRKKMKKKRKRLKKINKELGIG